MGSRLAVVKSGGLLGGERRASEQKGVMQWTGTLLKKCRLFSTSIRTCDVVRPLLPLSLNYDGLICFLALLPRSYVLVRCLREANVAFFLREV